MPKLYGIIGYPLSHTFSPAYFKKKFADNQIDARYHAFPLANINEFPALLHAHPGLVGLNVTIPHKRSVIPYLDEIDSVAMEIGAVNCIAIQGGKKKGYNTDVIGFEQSLLPLLQPQHKQALILGTGGASLAVAYVLKRAGIHFQQVSRTKAAGILSYEEITPEIINLHKLIINTTPLGMSSDIDGLPPIPYEYLNTQHLLYDLIYDPAETSFLSHGKTHGAAIKNGLEMLHLQAEASWEIWNK